MAGTPVTVRASGTLAAARRCICEIIAPSNQCLVVRRIDFTQNATNAAQVRTLLESKINGTASNGTAGSAPTVEKGDGDASITLQTSARGNFTADDITTTGEAVGPYGGYCDPTKGMTPWVGYLKLKQGTRFRIFSTSAAADNYTCTVLCEE